METEKSPPKNVYLSTNEGFRRLIERLLADEVNTEGVRNDLRAALEMAQTELERRRSDPDKPSLVLTDDQVAEVSSKWKVDITQFAPLAQLFLYYGFLHAGLPGGDDRNGQVVASALVREANHLEEGGSFQRKASMLAQANKELSHQVGVDGLTRANNRAQYDHDIKELVEEDEDFTLVLLDLDFFKEINDTHGHAVGDRTLQEFTKQIQSFLRHDGDRVYRYGGDEFVLILKNIDPKNVRTILERIRKAVSETEIVTEKGESVKFTCSMGAVNKTDLSPETPKKQLPERLFNAADTAVYQSKKAGRNKITQFLGD